MVVMKFSKDGNLDRYINLYQPRCEMKNCRLFLKLAEGLKALHKEGIHHCNIKPCNIIFDFDSLTFRLFDVQIPCLSDKKKLKQEKESKGIQSDAEKDCYDLAYFMLRSTQEFDEFFPQYRNDIKELYDICRF